MINSIANALKRFSDALQHARTSWIPIQEDVLSQLEDRLTQRYYLEYPEELIDDLKWDPAIYAGVLRTLSTSGSAQRPVIVEHCGVLALHAQSEIHPLDLLMQSPLEQVHGALEATQQLGSKHRFAEMELFQARVLEHVTVSTLAAETLAFAAGIDPELAYSASLLRSLGHSLTAWNFPKEYSTALLSLPPDQPFELRLRQTVGFTPESLSSALILDWGLTRELVKTVKHLQKTEHRPRRQELKWGFGENDDLATKLITIAEISQSLADIVHLEHKANAIVFWPKLQQVFNELLGDYGLLLVLEQAREKLLRCSPHPISLPMPPVLTVMAERIETLEGRYAALKENSHLASMPADARRRIEQFYRTFDTGYDKSTEVIQLIEELAPLLGIAEIGILQRDNESESASPVYWYANSGKVGPRKVMLSSQFGSYRTIVTSFHIKTLVSGRDDKNSEIQHVALPLGMRFFGKQFLEVIWFSSTPGFFQNDSVALSEYSRGIARLFEDYRPAKL